MLSLSEDLPIINKKYVLIKKIGQGAYGQIYKAKNLETRDYVAIKFEKHELVSEESDSGNQFDILSVNSNLIREIKVLIQLQKSQGFPKIYAYGYENGYLYMVLSNLGFNLFKNLKKCKGCFSLDTVSKIAIQTLERLSLLHSKGYVHRDIKPENLLCGLNKDKETIYLIDFGLSKYYLNEKKQHMQFQIKKPFIGTLKYASINAHKGYEQSRRDDIMSLGYTLILFLKGSLPWHEFRFEDIHTKLAKIQEMKEKTAYDELTDDIHPNFKKFMQYGFELGFFAQPNYDYLISLFIEMLEGKDLKHFDWDSKIRKAYLEKIPKSSKRLILGAYVDFEKINKKQDERNRNHLKGESSIFSEDSNNDEINKIETKLSQLLISSIQSKNNLIFFFY